jgi:methylmalonyl-CoA mutase
MSDTKHLFSEFESISDQAWRERLLKDLKGKDFEETLVWEDECGIKHQPYYRETDLNDLEHLKELQACQPSEPNWQILQSFDIHNEKVKDQVQNALEFGVDQVIVNGVDNLEDVPAKLGNKHKGKSQVKARFNFLPTEHLLNHFYVDPIGQELKSGKAQDYMIQLSSLFKERLNQLEPDRFLLVDASPYKNAGATIVQEMALSLEHALEYFDLLTEAGFTAAAIARNMEFKLSYSSSFFPELAKGRAMHYLIKKLYQAYDVEEEPSIWGEGSSYYLTPQDPYNNLLRATTMSMAAILGNCQKVSTPAFDQLAEPSVLGIRMAKNIHLILKEEAYFAQVKDMAAGAYYLESLSLQLAEAAWNRFRSAQNEGSLSDRFKNGSLKMELDASHEKRKQAYKEGKLLLGVNRYQNEAAEDLKVKQSEESGLPQRILANEI